MTSFADGTYIVRWNKTLSQLIIDLENLLESITKWFRKSALKFIDTKTEMYFPPKWPATI